MLKKTKIKRRNTEFGGYSYQSTASGLSPNDRRDSWSLICPLQKTCELNFITFFLSSPTKHPEIFTWLIKMSLCSFGALPCLISLMGPSVRAQTLTIGNLGKISPLHKRRAGMRAREMGSKTVITVHETPATLGL